MLSVNSFSTGRVKSVPEKYIESNDLNNEEIIVATIVSY